MLTLPPAIAVLSIGYQPPGSCPRAAGWSAATLCSGPSRHRLMLAARSAYGGQADFVVTDPLMRAEGRVSLNLPPKVAFVEKYRLPCHFNAYAGDAYRVRGGA